MENICGNNTSVEIEIGKNKISLLADIPKYLIVVMKGKKAPGKLRFTRTEPHAHITTFTSYKVTKPDPIHHLDRFIVG